MKKSIFFILFMMGLGILKTQAQYNTLNVIREDYVTVSSKEGISVSSVTPNQDKSYTVVLKNNNTNDVGEIKSCCFEWYLSYKGKRVSDYYQETIRCGKTATKQVRNLYQAIAGLEKSLQGMNDMLQFNLGENL